MKRIRAATCMMEPDIYELMRNNEPNMSGYMHDLVCADLIRRKLLTIQEMNDICNVEPFQRAELLANASASTT